MVDATIVHPQPRRLRPVRGLIGCDGVSPARGNSASGDRGACACRPSARELGGRPRGESDRPLDARLPRLHVGGRDAGDTRAVANAVSRDVVATESIRGRIQNQEAGASLAPPLTPRGLGPAFERTTTWRRLDAGRAAGVELGFQNR